MKILFFCPDFYPRNTGYANAFLNLIKAASKENQISKIDVLAFNDLKDNEEIKINKTTVYRLKKNNFKFYRFIYNGYISAQRIVALDAENNYDMILVETFEPIVMINFLPKKIQSKTVYRIHAAYETERRFFYPGLLHYISKKLVRYVTKNKVINICSTNSYHIDFAKEHFLDNNIYFIAQKKFFLLPNTFECNFNNDNTINDKIQVILLGRMDQSGYLQKGFDDFIDALSLINDNLLNKCQISIIGNGEYYDYYNNKVNKLALDKYIKLIKYIEHEELVKKLLQNDVVVMPSRYEGLSMFALESIATSNIVLYSKSGGLIDLVDNNGFVFEPQNIEEIAEKFQKIINLSDTERKEFKTNSYNLFIEKFSNKKVAEKLLQISTILGTYR